jgi:hypothetical protein
MCRTLFIFLGLAILPSIIFADDEISKEDRQVLESYMRIWRVNSYHYSRDGSKIAANIPMPIVKKYLIDAGFNWEKIAPLLYPPAKAALTMLDSTRNGVVPQAENLVTEYLQREYLFDQFDDFDTLKNTRTVKIARLSDLLEKATEGSIVVIMLDDLVFEAVGNKLSLLADDAKPVIDALMKKGVVVLGYTNTGYQGVSIVRSFLERQEINFSPLSDVRSLELKDNLGIYEGILAGQSLDEVVDVFSKVSVTLGLAKGPDVNIIFVSDKDIIATRIIEESKKIKANIRVFQCTHIPYQNEMEELAKN